MIGRKLAHYEITSHLGSGGMGDVYQATDSKLGRSVAIKVLPETFARDAERAARFEREARVLASLDYVSYCTPTLCICAPAESSTLVAASAALGRIRAVGFGSVDVVGHSTA